MEKTMTVKEFRMWLEGVEEMQPEEWSPDRTQWLKIRERINTIVESERAALPTLQSTIDERLVPAHSPTFAAPPALARPVPADTTHVSKLLGRGESSVKTPDIDTSIAPYDSSFV